MPPTKTGAGSGRRSRAPLPAVDARLVAPENRYEIVRGVVTYVPPADENHGVRHSKISALVEAHVKRTYEVASDMLTRTSEMNDMAPDVSVFPRARDAKTGGRKLEEVIFEVLSTERLKHAGGKAAEYVGRGVREVFAVDVKRQRALRWSSETRGWQLLANEGVIEDRVFATPLPIAALLDAAKVDDAVAAALLAKKTPVLEKVKSDAHEEGREEGAIEQARTFVLVALEARGLALDEAQRGLVEQCRDRALLARWLRRAVAAQTAGEVFA